MVAKLRVVVAASSILWLSGLVSGCLRSQSVSDAVISEAGPGESVVPFTDGATQYFVVTSPSAGASWPAGSSQTVSWSPADLAAPEVDLELWRGGAKLLTLAHGLSNSGTYGWSLPSALPNDGRYRIRVLATGDNSRWGASAFFSITGWRYRAEITVDASRASEDLVDYPVLVFLDPSTFNYGKAIADGSDLRCSSSSGPEARFDLAHWIESWDAQGTSKLWVNLPRIPKGQPLKISLYYGNPDATSASNRDRTFPARFVSTEGMSSMGGHHSYDWFEIQKGHTLRISPGQPLGVIARRIIIDGAVDGSSAGYSAGNGPGAGQGGGNSGGGGGGHGGKGASGAGGTPGAGGAEYDLGLDPASPAIDMGSGGGSCDGAGGAPGGGALWLEAHDLKVTGSITLSGGTGGTGLVHGGGGGAGGGILLRGYDIALAPASQVAANGGAGGGSTSPNHADGGGGGGGGVVKVIYEKSFTSGGLAVEPGGGGEAAPGGSPGRTFTQKAPVSPVAVSLGSEILL